MVDFTPELFIFDSVTQLVIVFATVYMYIKTKELYELSLQKGLKYLNTAMIFYIFSFGTRTIITMFDFFIDKTYQTFEISIMGLILNFFNIYTALLGGFFLAYSLIWRRFEKDRIKKFHISGVFGPYIIALLIAGTDYYLLLNGIVRTPFLFFGFVISMLLLAIIPSYMQCCREKHGDVNPFLALAGMGLGVYVVFLIENLFLRYLFSIHYYALLIAVVFTLTFAYHIMKMSR